MLKLRCNNVYFPNTDAEALRDIQIINAKVEMKSGASNHCSTSLLSCILQKLPEAREEMDMTRDAKDKNPALKGPTAFGGKTTI